MRVALAVLFCFGAGILEAKPQIKLIVGGVPAAHGEFPQIVQIRYNGDGGHYCGGTLVNSKWVLTAAHCALQPVNGYSVVVGQYRLNQDDGSEQLFGVSKIVLHKNYTSLKPREHDIAVMKLSEKVNFGPYAKPVKLVTSSPEIPSNVTAVGWGDLSEGDLSPSNVLMKVTVPMVSVPACKAVYGPENIVDGMICAGIGGKDSCQGDSGGPLFNSDGEQVGIVSWGFGCARPGYPGVYTDVASYNEDWIFWETLEL